MSVIVITDSLVNGCIIRVIVIHLRHLYLLYMYVRVYTNFGKHFQIINRILHPFLSVNLHIQAITNMSYKIS